MNITKNEAVAYWHRFSKSKNVKKERRNIGHGGGTKVFEFILFKNCNPFFSIKIIGNDYYFGEQKFILEESEISKMIYEFNGSGVTIDDINELLLKSF